MPKKGKSVSSRTRADLMLNFRCVDGEIVHVDPKCRYVSEYIDRLINSRDPRFCKPYIQDVAIPSHILSIFNDFCISCFEIRGAMLNDCFVKFIEQQAPPVRVQLIRAAYELSIPILFHLTCDAIDVMLNGKSTDEIPRKKGNLFSSTKLVYGNLSNTAMLSFLCMDSKIVLVDPICCNESEKLRQLFISCKGRPEKRSFTGIMIRSNILLKVNKFCVARFQIMNACAHDDNLLADILEDFHGEFIKKLTPPILVQLIRAAYKLRIQSLLHLTCDAIDVMLNGKSTHEILEKKRKSVSSTKLVDGNLSNKAMVRFLCMDSKIVHVDRICCYESEKIRWLLTTVEETKEKPGYIYRLPIKSIILSVVNDFCVSRFKIMCDYFDDDILLADMLEDFNVQFIRQQSPPVLVQLICAAYELRIKSLMDRIRNAIDDMLYGRSANGILKKKGKSVSTMPKKMGKSVSSTNLVDGNLSNKAMFRFHCLDGKIVHVDPICCCESERIHQFLTDKLTKEIRGDMGRLPIKVQITSNILSMVNDFCISRFEIMKTYANHHDNLLVDMLEEFNVQFIQHRPLPVLVQLKCAAYELGIKSLSDSTSNAIAHIKIDCKSSNKAMLRFRGLGKKIFHVDPRCCYESDYVRETLIQIKKDEDGSWRRGEGDIGRIWYMSPIPSNIFSMVNDFCILRSEIVNRAHNDNCLSDLLGDFDCRFVQKQTPTILVQLMAAAYSLSIQSLLNVTRNAIVDEIDGKSAEEIRRIFNMPDFEHKVWVQELVGEWGQRMIY